ncbi:hypothetical protein K3495_g8556 [Podosphaera aphanis]|nr:hypothetical protein K3495_g8556 [Podosphaera aphanis]
MAITLRAYRIAALCRKRRPIPNRYIAGAVSKFSTSSSRHDRKLDDIFPNLRKTSRISPEDYDKIEEYVKNDLADSDEGSGDESLLNQMFMNENEMRTEAEEEADIGEGMSQKWEDAFGYYNIKKLDAPEKRKKLKQTFMNMGESEPWEDEGMLPDDEDDIPSLGHGELELHRELRHYSRLAAWEMPLLYKLRKPFKPPTAATPLRFRYTTYMGEQHPAENKVVLEFSPADIPDLTEVQREKLKKLAGVRWNPETDTVKMSCESYETQAQNKRYLGDVLASLLRESRDSTDTMEDIPLYTKHHRFKKNPQFPSEWVMSEKRQEELKKCWKEQMMVDKNLEKQGLLVDGTQAIQSVLEVIDRTIGDTIISQNEDVKRVALRR